MVHGSEQSARELASALRTTVATEFNEVGVTLRATNHIYQCDLLYICAREHGRIGDEVKEALDKATIALGYSITSSAILSLAIVADDLSSPTQDTSIGPQIVPALVESLDPMAVIILDERVCGALYSDALVALADTYRPVVRIPNFFEALSVPEEKRQAWVYMQQATRPA